MALIEGLLAFLILSSSTLLLAVGVRWHLVLELVVNDSPGFRQSLYRVLDFSRGPGLVDVVGLHNVLENLLLGESALSLVLASYGFYYHIIVVWMIVFLILRHGDLVGTVTILCSSGVSLRMLKSGQIFRFLTKPEKVFVNSNPK